MVLALCLGLLCGFIGAIPIAGPTAVMVVERALSGKSLDALEIAIGGAIAEALYAMLAFLGMTAVLESLPWLIPVSKVAGAIILLALGLYFALGPPRAAHEPDSHVPRPRRGGKVVLGFVVTAVNPTLLVTWGAVVTGLSATGALRVEPLDAFPFALGVGAGMSGWFVVLCGLLGKFRGRFHHTTLDRMVRVMGWILVVIGVAVIGVVVRKVVLTGHLT